MKTQTIKHLDESFKLYIKLLNEFKKVEKGNLNDLAINEEFLREDIVKQLNRIKEDYF